MRYQVGGQIGEYRIVGHLGSGATGDVFRVEHSITHRTEAIKVFYASTLDEERAQRILREAMLQATLNHPNITAVHTAFWAEGDLLLVIEFVEGESLRQLLDRGCIPMPVSLSYARQILQALAHAHENGVMHRDISPANILITAEGRVKLTDFGLAKKPGDRRITQSGVMMGSIHYTAPEQIRSSADVDFRADLYSTGIVLYELLTGQKPLDAESPFELMLAHAETRPDCPSRWKPEIPAHIDAAVMRAIEKVPEQRFASAAEFLGSLNDPGAIPRRLPGRSRAATALIVLAASLGGFAALKRTPVPPRQTSIASTAVHAPAETVALPPDPEPPPLVDEPLPYPVRRVARKSAAPKKVPPKFLVAKIAGEEPPQLPEPPPLARAPVADETLPSPREPIPVMKEKATLEAEPHDGEEPPEAGPKPSRGFWLNLGRKVNIFRRR
ncbi:MAG TPA: serine/threonine-protein kinase [Bryobacteraceae bacterium]|nr:serine/threonine-protein kinase [Bryobacteraceae bacterium]